MIHVASEREKTAAYYLDFRVTSDNTPFSPELESVERQIHKAEGDKNVTFITD